MTWDDRGKKWRDDERPPAYVVSQVDVEVLKSAMIRAVVDQEIGRIRVGRRAFVLGFYKWNTDPHGEIVGNSISHIHQRGVGPNVPHVSECPIGKGVLPNKHILIKG